MNEWPSLQRVETRKPLNVEFKPYYHQVFGKFFPPEKNIFLAHDFSTLLTPIAMGVDVVMMGTKIFNEKLIKRESKLMRDKAKSGDLSGLTDYLRSIDKIIELTKDIDTKDDAFIEEYIKSIPMARRVISCYIDVIRFLKNPGEITWKNVQDGRATIRTVLRKKFPANQANLNLDSARIVILHSVLSKFESFYNDVQVSWDDNGGLVLAGTFIGSKKPPIFERYTKPKADRVTPDKDLILNNNGVDFSNGLFMAELLAMACNQEMNIQYGEGDTVKLSIR